MKLDKLDKTVIAIFVVLTVLFVGLKLVGFNEWSWWVVAMPTWVPILIVVGVESLPKGWPFK